MGSRSDSNQDTFSSLLPSLFSHFLFKKKKKCFADVAVAFCVECQSTLEQQVMTMLLHESEVRFQWQGYWESRDYSLLFISNMNLRNCDLHENSNTRICPIYKINLTVSPTLTIVVLHSALGFSFFCDIWMSYAVLLCEPSALSLSASETDIYMLPETGWYLRCVCSVHNRKSTSTSNHAQSNLNLER